MGFLVWRSLVSLEDFWDERWQQSCYHSQGMALEYFHIYTLSVDAAGLLGEISSVCKGSRLSFLVQGGLVVCLLSLLLRTEVALSSQLNVLWHVIVQ